MWTPTFSNKEGKIMPGMASRKKLPKNFNCHWMIGVIQLMQGTKWYIWKIIWQLLYMNPTRYYHTDFACLECKNRCSAQMLSSLMSVSVICVNLSKCILETKKNMCGALTFHRNSHHLSWNVEYAGLWWLSG